MRIAFVAFAGAITAIASTITPVLAKHSDAKLGEARESLSCSAYEQAPDGSWTQLPCNESGEHGSTPHQVQTQHRHPVPGAEQEAH